MGGMENACSTFLGHLFHRSKAAAKGGNQGGLGMWTVLKQVNRFQ